MNRWVSLLRGINVGGKNIVPMKDLRAVLVQLGYQDVQTYIQSGNCVFRSDHSDSAPISSEISERVFDQFGIRPGVITLSKTELLHAIAANPFAANGETDPKSVHFFFLEHKPSKPNLEALNSVRASTERFELKHAVFYLLAPNGVGRSKLVTQVERQLGVTVTARNQRTVDKLAGLIG